jgi:hypothetical protein
VGCDRKIDINESQVALRSRLVLVGRPTDLAAVTALIVFADHDTRMLASRPVVLASAKLPLCDRDHHENSESTSSRRHRRTALWNHSNRMLAGKDYRDCCRGSVMLSSTERKSRSRGSSGEGGVRPAHGHAERVRAEHDQEIMLSEQFARLLLIARESSHEAGVLRKKMRAVGDGLLINGTAEKRAERSGPSSASLFTISSPTTITGRFAERMQSASAVMASIERAIRASTRVG